MQVEVQEDECLDVTICDAADISLNTRTIGSSSSHDDLLTSSLETPVPTGGSDSPDIEDMSCAGPSTSSPDLRCDSRGVPGWEAVDNLAGYLISLNRTITALSTNEIAEILRLYSCLHAIDQSPSKYSLKCKKRILPGPWRASRKRSGSAPGQQAAERLFMTHGQAAQRPDINRISECIALKLLKEFREARNRPKDNKGKTFPITQAIVMMYCHIKQLLEDCRELLDKTNLVLVTINNTTVSSWLLDRQKRTDRDTLLQGVELPQQIGIAKEPLPKPRELPSGPVEHGHVPIEFKEPENREGEAVIRQRKYARSGTAVSSNALTGTGLGDTSPYDTDYSPAAQNNFFCPEAQDFPGWNTWSECSDWSFSPGYPSSAPPPPHGWSSVVPGYPSSAPPPPHGWSSVVPGYPSSAPPPPHGWSSLPPGYPSSAPPPPHGWSSLPPGQQPLALPPPENRQRAWRLHKAALEDEQRVARGEPPKKRQTKDDYHYQCKICGNQQEQHEEELAMEEEELAMEEEEQVQEGEQATQETLIVDMVRENNLIRLRENKDKVIADNINFESIDDVSLATID
ncbi:uncharacterized protein LOC130420406 [Triplophysa dalaica]|uniref:uncharacterized protein LOC130420406 n=1 Tax=Triplophysa dalaica TaxID=1582913 RepID=UPI0024DF5CA2|nr:uncharacterized protein LOC130420406 [Triplophysa dalaica]